MFKKCKNYRDEVECVDSFINRCEAIEKSHSWPEGDARLLAIRNLGAIGRFARVNLMLLYRLESGPIRLKAILCNSLGFEPRPDVAKEWAKIISHGSKLAFVVQAQFQIENVMRNILRELGDPAEPRAGFYNVAKRLTGRLNMPASLAMLNVPAMLRNSMHANGQHHAFDEKDVTVVVDGVDYEFQHDRPVRCGSSAHVAHALEASVDVLSRIYDHPEVSGLPGPLMDPAIWNLRTEPGG